MEVRWQARRRRVVGRARGARPGTGRARRGPRRHVDQLTARRSQGRQPHRRRQQRRRPRRRATVSVRAMRCGTGGALIGPRHGAASPRTAPRRFLVDVKRAEPEEGHLLPRRLRAAGRRRRGRARAAPPALADLRVKGGDPLQGKLATKAFDNQNGAAKAHAAQAPACTPGRAHALRAGQPRLAGARQRRLQVAAHRRLHGLRRADEQVPARHARRPDAAGHAVPERVQPRLRPQEQHLQHGGHAGPGHDDLLDHDRRRPGHVPRTSSRPTPATRRAGTIPTRWRTRPPTHNPVSATNPNPPACAPATRNASSQGVPCGETKLVITPAQPIPSGTTFKVVDQLHGPARASARTRRSATRAGSRTTAPPARARWSPPSRRARWPGCR